MATPSFGGVATAQGTTASSSTFALSTSGANRYLIVVVTMYQFGNPSTPTVIYNGVSMTQLGSALSYPSFGQGVRTTMFGLANPASGSNNVVVTLDGSQTKFGVAATYWTDAKQTGSIGSVGTANAESGTTSQAISSATDEIVIDGIGYDGTDMTAGAGQTLRSQVETNLGTAVSSEPGAASTTMSWTNGGGSFRWASVAVGLKYEPPFKFGAVAIAATATVAATGRTTKKGATALAATATLASAAQRARAGAALIAASAALASVPRVVRGAAAAIAGTAALNGAGVVTRKGFVPINAALTLSPAGRVVAVGAAQIDAVSALSADGAAVFAGRSQIAAALTLEAFGRRVSGSPIAINALLAVNFAAARERAGIVAINGTSDVAVIGKVSGIQLAEASIASLSDLDVIGGVVRYGLINVPSVLEVESLAYRDRAAQASSAWTSALSAAARLTAAGKAAIDGTLDLSAFPRVTRLGATSIPASAEVQAQAQRDRAAASSIAWEAMVNSAGQRERASAAAILAEAALSAIGYRTRATGASIASTLTLLIVGRSDRTGASLILGSVTVSPRATVDFQARAAVPVISDLDVVAYKIRAGGVLIDAALSLDIRPSPILLGRVVIVSESELLADGDLTNPILIAARLGLRIVAFRSLTTPEEQYELEPFDSRFKPLFPTGGGAFGDSELTELVGSDGLPAEIGGRVLLYDERTGQSYWAARKERV